MFVCFGGEKKGGHYCGHNYFPLQSPNITQSSIYLINVGHYLLPRPITDTRGGARAVAPENVSDLQAQALTCKHIVRLRQSQFSFFNPIRI